MIPLPDPTLLGKVLAQVRGMFGMTRREAAAKIAEATGRPELSVNSQLWTWDTGALRPELTSVGPLLDALGVELALRFKDDPCDAQLTAAVRAARRELDQDHPWIPGGVFKDDQRLKPLLLAFLDSLVPTTRQQADPQ